MPNCRRGNGNKMQALASSRYGETVQFIQDEQEMSIVNRYGIKYVAQIWNQILDKASKQGLQVQIWSCWQLSKTLGQGINSSISNKHYRAWESQLQLQKWCGKFIIQFLI